jgi:hypothetical protein
MRAPLSLYELDRPALVTFSKELKAVLLADDRAGLARLLEAGAALADRIASGPRAVDWFLRAEADPDAAPLFASLRRVAKKRALSQAWTSDALSLEGRLRNYDVLREEREVAALTDKLLDPARLPWFLVRPGATGGWLDGAKRERLTSELRGMRDALPAEIAAFAEALADIDGDVIAHDML